MMELVALSIPWLLVALAILSIVLLAFKKWKLGVILLLISIIGNWQYRCLPINLCTLSDESAGNTLTVLSFNSSLSPLNESVSERRQALVELIATESPDVVFITENFYYSKDLLWEEIKDIYPYPSKTIYGVGNRVYSKYPISVDTVFYDSHMSYGINCCWIDCTGTLLNVLGVHLSSNNYNESMEYMTPDSVTTRNQAMTYMENIMNAGEYRKGEALKIVDLIERNIDSIPTIIMGDFNDVCGSPTLNILETSGMKDAWWEGGLSYGATIHHPLPFRIDHIMYNDRLKLRSIKKVNAKGLSDHDALVATFSIK